MFALNSPVLFKCCLEDVRFHFKQNLTVNHIVQCSSVLEKTLILSVAR